VTVATCLSTEYSRFPSGCFCSLW